MRRLTLSEKDLVKYNNAVLLLQTCECPDHFDEVVMQGMRIIIPFESGTYFRIGLAAFVPQEEYFVDLDGTKMFNDYVNYYMKIDPMKHYAEALASQSQNSLAVRVSDLVNYSDWDKTEVRADFWFPNNIYHMAVVELMNNKNLSGVIEIFRNKSQINFDNDEMTLLKLYASQIEVNHNRLKIGESWRDTGFLLHQAKQGVCIFDDKLNNIYANDLAKNLFQQKEKELYNEIRDICQYVESAARATTNRFFSYSGIFNRKNAEVSFNLFSCNQNNNQIYIFFVFDYRECTAAPTRSKDLFTAREKEILQLLSLGKTNKEISEQMFINLETVKTHLRNLLQKTNSRSRTELLTKALTILFGAKKIDSQP